MKENKSYLINQYNSGVITDEEQNQLEELIANGSVEISDLNNLREVQDSYQQLETPEPSQKMTNEFMTYLNAESAKTSVGDSWIKQLFNNNNLNFQLAYTVVILIVGFLGGYLIKANSGSNTDIEKLSSEVNTMKEMMLLSLIEKESTSDRLKAVNLTSEIPKASKKVTDALFKTLNNDDNVNVRLATIEALQPYLDNPDVRQQLIGSIEKQESPMVQVAMAELMVNIQENRSVDALKELLKKESTPPEIKERIKESIDILI